MKSKTRLVDSAKATSEEILSQTQHNRKTELEIILKEYQSIRDEIISLQEFARQNITTTYAGIGVLGAISPFIIEYNLQLVFLIFPIFFLSLALTTTKYALAGLTMGAYLKNSTIPHTRKLLSELDDTRDYGHIFSWEEGKGVVRKYGWFFLPANGAHYWVILFSALICVLAYFVFPPEIKPDNFLVYGILIIDSAIFIYSIIVGLIAGFSR